MDPPFPTFEMLDIPDTRINEKVHTGRTTYQCKWAQKEPSLDDKPECEAPVSTSTESHESDPEIDESEVQKTQE